MNNSWPKVSVLISVYNGEKTIAHCINSMLLQEYHNFEIIVINDGSTDRTGDLLDEIKDKRLKVFHRNHEGLVKALNYGLEQCSGEYIARMDADDWSPPERLKLQVKVLFQQADVGVVSSLVKYAGNRTKNLGYALHVDWLNTLASHQDIWVKRFEDAPVANPSCMFRFSLLEKFGYYKEEAFPEDYEFWLRLLHEGVKFTKVNEYLLHWSDLPGRITRTLPQYSTNNFHKVKAQYLAKWIKGNYSYTPYIYIFGNGKQVRNKVKHLINNQLPIHRFIDVKAPPYQDDKVIYFKDLPKPKAQTLVLSYIGDRKGKQEVIKYLSELGYTEGKNFFMMN